MPDLLVPGAAILGVFTLAGAISAAWLKHRLEPHPRDPWLQTGLVVGLGGSIGAIVAWVFLLVPNP